MEEAKKPTLFKRMIDAIYSVWPRADETSGYRALSRFRLLAESMLDDKLPDDVINASELCEEAFKIAKRRMHTSKSITEIEDKMRDIECYGKLSPAEAKELKSLMEGFLAVSKDKTALQYQLTDFDKGVNAMQRLEGDAQAAIPHIQEAEKMQRILKQDLGYLEGEKTDLEYERETLLSGMEFANKFAIVSVGVLSLCTLLLAYLFLIDGRSIFFPATALVLVAIVVITVLYMFRRRIDFELKLNAKKQARAVELLNKKVANLAHYTNTLNFSYAKYKVRNSQMLKNNLKEYDKYKHVTGRLDSIREVLYETERRIEIFLREKNINSGRFSVEQFAKTMDVDDKQRYYNELAADRVKLENRLVELDARHVGICELLEELKQKDETQAIEAMMQLYFEEAAKLMEKESSTETPGAEGNVD